MLYSCWYERPDPVRTCFGSSDVPLKQGWGARRSDASRLPPWPRTGLGIHKRARALPRTKDKYSTL
eukprot:2884793-Prymnesium_polylepis.1